MKKYLALVLALVMVLALCACGDTAEEAAPAEETVAEEAAPAAEAEAPVAEAPAAEGDWAGYQAYLKENNQGAPDADEFAAQVDALASWDEIDQSTSPWDMLFSESGPYLSTYEEWLAGDIRTAAVSGMTDEAGMDAAAEGDKKDEGAPEGDKKDEGAPEGEAAEGDVPSDVPEMAAAAEPTKFYEGSRDEAAYKEYLKEYYSNVSDVADNIDEFYAAIDAGSYDEFPVVMAFEGWFSITPATLDEFLAGDPAPLA